MWLAYKKLYNEGQENMCGGDGYIHYLDSDNCFMSVYT